MSRGGPTEDETCRKYVVPLLKAARWDDDQIVEQYRITDGRVVPLGRRYERKKERRTDYLLQMRPGVSVALVEAKRSYKLPGDGLQQAMRDAQDLDLPLAYSSNGKGIVEHDFDTGRQAELSNFPSPDETWNRYLAWKGIADDRITSTLELPFSRDLRNPDGTVKEPRYYQTVAIQRSIQRIVASEKRLLLTMATGTGKTFTALQIVWKLWNDIWLGRKPRVLYLADRNVLVDQPITREFKPVFGDSVWKIQTELKTGREVYFALYQALADSGDSLGLFRDYSPGYFDLIIVDECHRGSASDESSWRAILEHFTEATQLGMTATPRRDENRDTYEYFGEPIYTYSLAQGIEDGFLAPYRVRRVVLSPDAYGWQPEPGELDRFGREIPDDLYTTREFERVVSLLTRTELAAKHLTRYLKATDRFDKTIVFCVDQEHAEQMRMALHNENGDITAQHPHYIARIVSDEGEVGRDHLDNFADPEKATPVIATTSRLLSTGVDLPTVKNIVIFRPIGSMIEFKQIIGRGTRLYPDADKMVFDIIDYSRATALFEDPAFDGPPEAPPIVDEVGGDDDEPLVVEEPEPEFVDEPGREPDVEDLEGRAEKYYVDDVAVYVTSDTFYLIDEETGRPRAVEYRHYVGDQVRALYAQTDDLRARWRTIDGRDEVRAALAERGIAFEELAERAGLVEADPFDLLIHLAWNAPMVSRRERASRVRREHAQLMEQFREEARAVLDELLEKYAEYGVSELSDLGVLQVAPFPAFGTPTQIAELFGGPGGLKDAVNALQEALYAA